MSEFKVTLTHDAGTCPIYDNEMMKKFRKLQKDIEEAAGKCEVEVVSKWSPTRVHETFWIIRAPSKKAVKDYFDSIGLTLWNKFEVQEIKMLKEWKTTTSHIIVYLFVSMHTDGG